MMKNPDILPYKFFKMVLLGDVGTGKSSIVQRFVFETFTGDTGATLGACFHEKEITIGPTTIKLAVWDTAGQEKYASLAHMYYKNARAALVVFDLTNEKSFERAREWIREVNENAKEEMVVALVGNKTDLHNRKIYNSAQYAEELNMLYFEVSAKSGIGVDDAFITIADLILKQGQKQDKLAEPRGSQLTNQKKDKKQHNCNC